MATSSHLLSDLRARRLARRLIELNDQLDVELDPIARGTDDGLLALEQALDALIARLERAIDRLEHQDPLRVSIEAAIAAHRDASRDGFALALASIRDAMRRSSPPPPSLTTR